VEASEVTVALSGPPKSYCLLHYPVHGTLWGEIFGQLCQKWLFGCCAAEQRDDPRRLIIQ
jgi:hypothetical protein